MPLSEQDKELLVNCSDLPIRATLATPIHIDGQLYGMINMDSSKTPCLYPLRQPPW